MPQSRDAVDLVLFEPTEQQEISVGVNFRVSGTAIGIGGAEPDVAIAVTIEVGSQPRIKARLIAAPGDSKNFDETVSLAIEGKQWITVTAKFANKSITRSIQVSSPGESWCRPNIPWTNYPKTEGFSDEDPVPLSTCSPQTLAALVSIVRDVEASGRRVHAFGSRWAFSGCARSSDVVVDTTRLDQKLQTVQRAFRQGSSPVVFHVEAGIRISNLNRLLDSKGLALETMGGASGQTIAGAISTGTHGGDKDIPPLADGVLAIHLVGCGGKQYWIEPSSGITDDTLIRQFVAPGVEQGNVIYDDKLFQACLVSVGCLGVIYSVVLRVRQRFDLVENTVASNWGQFKQDASLIIDDRNNPFLQVALDPYGGICLVTTRTEAAYTGPTNRGNQLERVKSAVQSMVVAANLGVALGQAISDWCHDDTLSGEEKFAQIINALLASPFTNRIQMIMRYAEILHAAFPVRSLRGTSFSIMDLGYGQPVRASQPGLSFEVAFPALDSGNNLGCAQFVDAAINEIRARNTYFAGYMSLRFTGATRAILGMQQWDRTCCIEVAVVQGVNGLLPLVTELYNLALQHGGLPHWGQLLDLGRTDDATKYPRYDDWIQVYGRLSQNFSARTFSNKLSERWKLTIPSVNARFVSQNVPDKMRPGEQAQVLITIHNTGATTWDPAIGYNLGSQDPADNMTWGTHRLPIPTKVAPGAQVAIKGTITAPTTPGLFAFRWRMVQDVVQWFGEFTPATSIFVGDSSTVAVPDVTDLPAGGAS